MALYCLIVSGIAENFTWAMWFHCILVLGFLTFKLALKKEYSFAIWNRKIPISTSQKPEGPGTPDNLEKGKKKTLASRYSK